MDSVAISDVKVEKKKGVGSSVWERLWEIYAFLENWKPELHTFKSGAG